MAKLLVVEDDKDLNRILCHTLRDKGYDVVSAENGLEALKSKADEWIKEHFGIEVEHICATRERERERNL